jgi:flagellin-like protein
MRIFPSFILNSFLGENDERRRKSFRVKIRSGRKEKRGIAEIISTLLMILIAVASAAILYTYVTGLVGGDTTSAGTAPQSSLSIDSTCVSVLNRCDGIYGYFVAVRNTGSSAIPGGTAQIYFANLATGNTAMAECSIPANLGPGIVFTCAGPNVITYSQGQQVTIKVVDADDSSALNTVRATP